MTDDDRGGHAGGLPNARREGLIVRELDDELLVYDVGRDLASALNGFAARVWRACDGLSDVRAIAAQLGGGVEPEAVARALAMLRKSGLVDMAHDEAPAARGRSRRQALLAVGAGAAAVAVVTTIAAPAVAGPISCLANGSPCTTSGQCCSNFCNVDSCEMET